MLVSNSHQLKSTKSVFYSMAKEAGLVGGQQQERNQRKLPAPAPSPQPPQQQQQQKIGNLIDLSTNDKK